MLDDQGSPAGSRVNIRFGSLADIAHARLISDALVITLGWSGRSISSAGAPYQRRGATGIRSLVWRLGPRRSISDRWQHP